MRQRLIGRMLAVAVVLGAVVQSASAAESKPLTLVRAQHAELRRKQAEVLADLAGKLEQAGAADAAAEARKLAVPPDGKRIEFEKLPAKVQAEPSLELPREQRDLLQKLRTARQKCANDLFLLSKRALGAGSVGYAYELVREAAVQDPDNVAARKILGYVRAGDEWLTAFQSRMRRTGQVWHPKFGWIPEADVRQYEAGQRKSKGRWITAEQDAELHRDFENAWEVRTEHYLVKTNHSLERGVEVATRLEAFHDFFVETFAGFYNKPEDLKTLFGNGTARVVEAKPHEVHYFRTRDEYNKRLVSKIPTIAVTNGLYYTSDRVAYFFHDDKLTSDDTLYHEETHQLMYECLSRDREVANQAHFWVIEGIACYMESFRPGEGKVSLGDPNHVRIVAARYRYLTDKHYVPLGKFAAMGLLEFQTLPFSELQRNYSEAAGLAHFFMQYDDGRYRDALVEHLSQLYHTVGPGRRPVQNLAELTGIAYTELDRQYGEYMKALGAPTATAARE